MSKNQSTAQKLSRQIYIVYVLVDPVTRKVRYVGATSKPMWSRLSGHVSDAKHKRSNPVREWLLALGKRPIAIVVEVVPDEADWQARERRWIRRFSEHGCDLLNVTKGGLGILGVCRPKSVRDAISRALQRGSWFHCEQCDAKFWRKPKDIKQGDCRFCCRECYAQWQKGRTKDFDPIVRSKGTQASAQRKREQTQCKRGHALSGDNIYVTKDGRRVCKQCRRIHKRNSHARNSGKATG